MRNVWLNWLSLHSPRPSFCAKCFVCHSFVMSRTFWPINSLFTLSFLFLFVPLSMAMICYNSQAINPSRESICEKEEVCFGEYYSLRQSSHDGSLAHFFDRFCVHRQHCISRGFWPEGRECLQLFELDGAVAQTFRDKLISERLDPNRLQHTRFCCCSDKNLCNRMDGKEIGKLFNVTITPHQQQQMLINRERIGLNGPEKNSAVRQISRRWTRQMMIIALLLCVEKAIFTSSTNEKR